MFKPVLTTVFTIVSNVVFHLFPRVLYSTSIFVLIVFTIYSLDNKRRTGSSTFISCMITELVEISI